jgi:hypothetical protein
VSIWDYLELLKWGAIVSIVNLVLLLVLLADSWRSHHPDRWRTPRQEADRIPRWESSTTTEERPSPRGHGQ